MQFSNRLIIILKKSLPSPFSIALILTLLAILFSLIFTNHGQSNTSYFVDILGFWEKGFWELLAFTMQMMLMLVLGHVLALSKSVNKIIQFAVKFCNSTPKAALIVTFLTLSVSFLNWGLGLIFGAIFARKVGEYAQQNNLKINYPLIGAAGYSGLMFWHGGFSGSAPLKIAEKDHFLFDKIGQILLDQTILSNMNITISIAVLIILPLSIYLLAKQSVNAKVELRNIIKKNEIKNIIIDGAERLDYSRIFTGFFAFIFIFIAFYKGLNSYGIGFLNLNYINFVLFGFGLLLHGNISNFVNAVNKAIVGSSGILIQFPLYAGIMGIMKYSGLTLIFTDFFIDISTATTFPIYTLISAGIVNIFVPSGGGQWAVQGPIIVDAAQQLGVPISKAVMALAYGDELTNMLQPFWALPLLGITGLKAKELIPYTLFLMIIGFFIYATGLFLF
ncbi:MAG: short-chain fatty acid transporter [Bacteroidales bacterium]|nr:short-chain fatty acid transporter [Bacteroidales bacterium]MBN2758121.1 short-chain fatty acid transporter [Bacteroidales bacterium]